MRHFVLLVAGDSTLSLWLHVLNLVPHYTKNQGPVRFLLDGVQNCVECFLSFVNSKMVLTLW